MSQTSGGVITLDVWSAGCVGLLGCSLRLAWPPPDSDPSQLPQIQAAKLTGNLTAVHGHLDVQHSVAQDVGQGTLASTMSSTFRVLQRARLRRSVSVCIQSMLGEVFDGIRVSLPSTIEGLRSDEL